MNLFDINPFIFKGSDGFNWSYFIIIIVPAKLGTIAVHTLLMSVRILISNQMQLAIAYILLSIVVIRYIL